MSDRASSTLRGHDIAEVEGTWIYTDNGEPVATSWKARPCGYCNLPNSPEGHDACLGTLPGVMNACCGHGTTKEAYVQFPDGRRYGGARASAYFQQIVRSVAASLDVTHAEMMMMETACPLEDSDA